MTREKKHNKYIYILYYLKITNDKYNKEIVQTKIEKKRRARKEKRMCT